MLSKDWTLERLKGVIRSKANIPDENVVNDPYLIDVIHTALMSVARDLGDAKDPEYRTRLVVKETSDYIDLDDVATDSSVAALRINSINSLYNTVCGDCIPTDAEEIRYLYQLPKKQAHIFYYWEGRYIRMYKGSGLTSYGIFTLTYEIIPVKATADATYIDLSDKHMDLLIFKTIELLKVSDG